MKTTIITLLTVAFGLSFSTSMSAQAPSDSLSAVRKIKELTLRISALEKQIAEADKKRNVVINGVAPETVEAMNDHQDSICLSLRSQMVSAQLELKELMPTAPAVSSTQSYGGLIHNLQSISQPSPPVQTETPPAQTATHPAKPTKPTKK